MDCPESVTKVTIREVTGSGLYYFPWRWEPEVGNWLGLAVKIYNGEYHLCGPQDADARHTPCMDSSRAFFPVKNRSVSTGGDGLKVFAYEGIWESLPSPGLLCHDFYCRVWMALINYLTHFYWNNTAQEQSHFSVADFSIATIDISPGICLVFYYSVCSYCVCPQYEHRWIFRCPPIDPKIGSFLVRSRG